MVLFVLAPNLFKTLFHMQSCQSLSDINSQTLLEEIAKLRSALSNQWVFLDSFDFLLGLLLSLFLELPFDFSFIHAVMLIDLRHT